MSERKPPTSLASRSTGPEPIQAGHAELVFYTANDGARRIKGLESVEKRGRKEVKDAS